jgi:hypothetical protein
MTDQTDPSPPHTIHSANQLQEILPAYSEDDIPEVDLSVSTNRIKLGLPLAIFGYLIFLLGARPSLFGLDRSPVVGFVQISVFLIGLAIISLGSYITLDALWPEGKKTIAAQIGSRLISTGYVICIFTGMADIFGLGSHPLPEVFFGPLQARGMTLGMMTIAVGFLLMIRYKRLNNHHRPNNLLPEELDQKNQDQDSGAEGKLNFSIMSLFQ